MIKRLWLLLVLCVLPVWVSAQTVNVTATDTSTGARVQVGDAVNTALRTNCVSGCAGGTSDSDDGTIAGSQTTGILLGLSQVWDGSNWKRETIGTAGSPSAQVVSVQGIASGVGLRIWDGNDYLLIDGSGNIGVTGTVSVSGIGPGSQIIGKVGIDQTTPGTTNLVSSAQSGTWTITCGNCSGSGVSVNEDVASASADPGTPAYTVRQDAPAGSTSTDGDYQPLKTDSIGRLWVNCGTGCAGGTQFAEDAASANADVGTLAMARRTATPANTSGTDLDYEVLQMSAGRLWVDASGVTLTVGSHAVTNVGTFATQVDGALLTSSQLIDDIIRSEDVASADGHAGASVLTVRQDTLAGSTSADGDYQPFKTDSVGRLWINCSTGCSGGTQYAEDQAHASGDLTIFVSGVRRDTTPSSSSGTAGDYSAFNIDANGRLYVNAALYNGTDGSLLTPSVDQTLDAAITTTGPLMVGRGSTATPTASSADGDATALWVDLSGRVHATYEKAEDVAHTSGDIGAFVLTKRTDSAATSAGTDGEYATLNTDASGRLWVNCGTGCSGGTQFAEDAAAVSADVGTVTLAVRQDTPAGSTSTDGDYTPLKSDSIGRLWVNCATGCSGGTQYVEDAASAGGETMTLTGIVRQDTLTSVTSTDGDYAYAKGDSLGRLYVNTGTIGIEDAAETAAGNLAMAGTVRRDTAASSAGTTGDNATLNTDATGQLWVTEQSLQTEDVVNTGGAPLTMMGVIRRNSPANLADADNDNTNLIVTGNLGGSGGRLYVGGNEFEDNPSANNDLGMIALAIRDDTLDARSTTEGDYEQLHLNANGALWNIDVNSAALLTSNQLQDDVVMIEDAPETAGGAGVLALSVRRDVAASSSGASGDNSTVNVDALGLLWGRHLDPCSGKAKVTDPFSLTARGVLIAASASNKNYICSITMVAGAAEVLNIVEGTGTTCQTGTAAIAGSTTAANGMSVLANGGVVLPGGDATMLAGKTANVDTCFVPSGSNRVAGFVTYVQAP